MQKYEVITVQNTFRPQLKRLLLDKGLELLQPKSSIYHISLFYFNKIYAENLEHFFEKPKDVALILLIQQQLVA